MRTLMVRFTPRLIRLFLATTPAVIAAAWFARAQELWVDETTQLSGLTLNPIDVVGWLSGHDASRFGVPGDRMPPMSYWVGWLWSQVFGLSENSLRALGIVAVALSLALVVDLTWSLGGSLAVAVVALVFGLSPNFTTLGPEIRAYPFVLLCSALVSWLTVRLCADESRPTRGLWVALAVTCLTACYCHFFGLVLSGAAGLAWLYICWQRRLSLIPPIATGATVGVGALGLLPFLLSATAISPSVDPGASGHVDSLRSMARLGYRLLGGHPALAVVPIAGVLTVAGALLCVLVVLLTWRRQPLATRALLVSIVSGLLVTTVAGFLSTKFDAFSVTYNCWVFPQLAVVVGVSAASMGKGGARWARWHVAPAALASLGTLIGSAVLLLHANVFAHGAGDRIVAVVRANQERALVLHDAAGAWGHTFFPLLYSFGPALPQGLAQAPTGEGGVLAVQPLAPSTEVDLRSVRGRQLIVLSTRTQGAEELAAHLRHDAEVRFTSGPLITELERMGCSVTQTQTMVTLAATQLIRLDCK